MKEIDYFLKYVKVDTQSSETSETSPSTEKQLNLSKMILEDLINLNVDAKMDEFGQVYAFIRGEDDLETIGFNAHIDTATELSGANVNPIIHENYDGNDIKLNDQFTLSSTTFPYLKTLTGKTIITTDGNTLLGADDKAGISILMNVVKFFQENPNIKHHPFAVLFTCDEEVGRGSEHFDKKLLNNASYGFTIDGASPLLVSYENFNAAHMSLKFIGKSIHPGEAKGKMINASSMATLYNNQLPSTEVPEQTEGYEGFHHLVHMSGHVEEATLIYIIRDHDKTKLENRVNNMLEIAKQMEKNYPGLKVEINYGYDYRNMAEILNKDRRALDKIESVYKRLGLKIEYEPIRGGTDGATFSYLGMPCPNLGTGSYNHHGRYEYLVLQEYLQMIKIVENIIIKEER